MEEIESLEKILAPYGKEIEFQQVKYDNGFTMLRLRIKEGKRFTTLDLDPNTVNSWVEIMSNWKDQQNQD